MTTEKHIKTTSKNEYSALFFGDESGNLFGRDRFFIISLIRFNSVNAYNQFSRIAKNKIDSSYVLKQEIKSAEMFYKMKRNILNEVYKKIDYNVWFNIIDKHEYQNKKYIALNKNTAFSQALQHLVENYVLKHNHSISYLYIDKRPKETQYRFIQNNKNIVEYTTSHTNYGIQLADLLGGTTRRHYENPKDIQYERLYKNYIQTKVLGTAKGFNL